jgi:Mannosylglycerate hydrolase MGH1-like glycoside hydrolase domain/Glycosyl hydrolase family 65, C-terminal domain
MDSIKAARSGNRMNRLMPAGVAAVLLILTGSAAASDVQPSSAGPFVLQAESFKHYIDSFNAQDDEIYPGYITNGDAWNFLKQNIPLFECPDKDIEEIYYFRWWTYRKHIKLTPDGFIITEFLPDVPWAGKDDSIVCAAGHHLYEGRWLADPKYLDDYSRFWFRQGRADPRQYSTWLADALWARYLVNGDTNLVRELLPDLVRNYEGWEKSHLGTNGLFWQTDDRDGMEMSISGNGYRPTINSYLYGDATAIAKIAGLTGRPDIARQFRAKAARLKRLVQEKLWNPNAQFFEVLKQDGKLANVRELLGYTPWYFNLPDADQSVAWRQLMDPKGFFAPYGPTTAEQRSPDFRIAYSGHECQWNGPSWPYATAITLTAMANLLDDYRQNVVSRRDYFDLLKIYTKSQHLKLAGGRVVPWIDEDLDPYTGTWIARKILKQRGGGIPERGKDYNHSTYCDLIITGLVGLRPRADNIVEIDPLVPDGLWNYFCLDNVHYHGHVLTIFYDKTGNRYGKGKGLHVLEDGREIAESEKLERLSGQLKPTVIVSP